ncbi:MAG: DNA-directed RNA polymerase subunit beta' [Anaerolineaceae bacterium]|nr:DNA-directed RNA polymerase subunit beta' [Anaerolineae bacterium]MBL1171105.1 DNA-directed RNA polymerase subunit beta' [Chloroflexota bacterium]MBV6466866.1 DNA-directed RNA polymerase subunit beta' [Anaerolineales bacterium]MCE7906309.1 DNA-directed RNA polymerase subunit beta' [Anaerolineae bacterium CFX3]MDL1926826.1 DNA-directed RNA polymerase subunit beta' [Anaerolineae bacterium AMX1]GER78700.1 DNA-directed RNA polymerase subunit beta' [Candidatus Denitrolinea symbiosum]GJQ38836.1 
METKGLNALRISLASPETILSWSYGEVLKPETINYRRLRPEKDGLFCEAIFGPTRDWQCYCGKYKNPRYKGITCDKCGVEVTRAAVRRERMGHITLATPVAHIWYTRRIPSYLGMLLDISRRNLDRVLYFAQYIVTYVDEEARNKALKRLEDEISVSDREQAAGVNARIAEIKTQRDHAISELTQRRNALEASYDEQVAERLDPVIKEGQKLEKTLQDQLGKPAKKDIMFGSTGETLVSAGTIVAAKHISQVQKIVKARLEAVENELKDQKQKELETLKTEVARLKAEAEQEMDALRNELEDQSSVSQGQNTRLRDELLELRPFTFLSEMRYRELRQRWGQVFRADMGAEAFYDLLKRLDLDKLSEELWREVKTTKSKQKRKKATTRLKVVEAFRRSGNRPEWMELTVLPVIPPDLRPMVQLDGGRFATSDLNDLYRRVINRNNRLKRLLELGAPDVIIRNEKRMLQEAVDSLIDNSQRGKALSRRGRRELKSLSDMLKGKKGRFRRNLLGKRVDYSGRSVIVVGPQLKLYQCGLPKSMALELYRPFVIARLVQHNYAANVKGARRLIERNRPEVWEALESVIGERPVLLNRAPTLHRLGIQAFEPILIEGSAIQLHPLVTTAFNADFDGDQMAVHVPLSQKAVQEARELMLSSKNLLKPADGEPIISPSKDMVLGVYYLTMKRHTPRKGDGRAFADLDEVELAYQLNQVDIHSLIKVRVDTWYDDNGKRLAEQETRLVDTTVGRVIFNRVLPEEVQFVNRKLDKGGVKDLIAEVYELCGQEVTTNLADSIKRIGFEYAMKSGITLAVADIAIPPERAALINEALAEVEIAQRDFRRGLLTEQEKNEREIEIWQKTTDKVADAVKKHMDPDGNLSTMATSGATKGGFSSISQLAGMRGLMADPSGRIIPLPIRSNFREGLTALEYFISTHGSRKGLADTALRTADAGYLTRRLVDIAQDIIINEHDCGTKDGIWIRKSDDVAGEPLGTRLYSRLVAERVLDPRTGEVLAEYNDVISHELARRIVAAGVEEVKVRSALTCELDHGICAKCYGLDLGRGTMVEMGAAVGIVAAQSIGEPGTQLTLRTFHTGGVAAGGDITTGLPRVEELFEARKQPKGEAVVAEISGTVRISQSDKYADMRLVKIEHSELVSDAYDIPEDWKIVAKSEAEVKTGDVLAKLDDATITAQRGGRVRVEKKDRQVIVSYDQREEKEEEIPTTSRLLVRDGDKIEAGEPLTEGSLNPHRILRIRGREACELYLMGEVQKVYRSQGQNIHDKHFEVVIRKMLSKVQVTRPGDTKYLPGDAVDRLEIRRVNEALLAEGKQPAKFAEVLLGVTKASLSTDSFLSASSFQHTIKVLAGAAIASTTDPLYGLKENVIIGKLIPAGTGFTQGRFKKIEGEVGSSQWTEIPESAAAAD